MKPHLISHPKWLNEEKIVQRLIEQIHPSKDDNVSVPDARPPPLRVELVRKGRSGIKCVPLLPH